MLSPDREFNRKFDIDEETIEFKRSSIDRSKISLANWNRYYPSWSKLHSGWYYRLAQLCDQSGPYRQRLVIYQHECDEGDCLFDVAAIALSRYHRELHTIALVRRLVADQITSENFTMILESYRLAVDHGEFEGEWDPYHVQDMDQLKRVWSVCGNTYWGDHLSLALLSEVMQMNLILLKTDSRKCLKLEQRYQIMSTGHHLKYPMTVLIHYIDQKQFDLVGYCDDHFKIQIVFSHDEIPREIQLLLSK